MFILKLHYKYIAQFYLIIIKFKENEMRTSGETFNTSIEIIYNYEHEKAIDEATEVKFLQEMYKK